MSGLNKSATVNILEKIIHIPLSEEENLHDFASNKKKEDNMEDNIIGCGINLKRITKDEKGNVILKKI